jgi:4a-hydroxytetrahydrobiopterin dehydratase
MSSKRIITCMLMNLLATPGLGSLMARRWFEGIGQTILSVGGFILMLVWFYKLVIVQFYGQMNGTVQPHPVGWIGLLGAILFAIAWLWSLVTSISLMRSASRDKTAVLETYGASKAKLDEAKIISTLGTLPGWQRDGQMISRTYEFKDFIAAMKFVNAVAELAESAQHHPDIDVRWNKVLLALTTHDAGGLTQKDMVLARQCDALSVR